MVRNGASSNKLGYVTQVQAIINLKGYQNPFICLKAEASFSVYSVKFFQFGISTNPPDWVQLYLKELNPCDPQKGLIPFWGEEGINTHTNVMQ